MFTRSNVDKKSADGLHCESDRNNKQKNIPKKVAGEVKDYKHNENPKNNPSNPGFVNQKTNKVGKAHKKPPYIYEFFGSEDLSMGLGNLIAFYLFTITKSIPINKIAYYFIEKPNLLGKYFSKDDFYFPQFILWIGICGVIFGIRCILLPEQWPKGFLIVYDIFFSILMLSIPAYSTIKYLTAEAIFNFMFFLIAWGILFFSRIYLLHKGNYYTKRCD